MEQGSTEFFHLVSPKRVLYLVHRDRARGEDELKYIAKVNELDAHGIKNLRQLLGWVEVGAKRITPRGKSASWQLLSNIRWLKHGERSELVPIVGTVKNAFTTVVEPHPHMKFKERSLANVLDNSLPHAGRWKKLTDDQVAEMVTPQLVTLRDGMSLDGFTWPPSAPAPPTPTNCPPPVRRPPSRIQTRGAPTCRPRACAAPQPGPAHPLFALSSKIDCPPRSCRLFSHALLLAFFIGCSPDVS